jgi:hypothetical protein
MGQNQRKLVVCWVFSSVWLAFPLYGGLPFSLLGRKNYNKKN